MQMKRWELHWRSWIMQQVLHTPLLHAGLNVPHLLNYPCEAARPAMESPLRWSAPSCSSWSFHYPRSSPAVCSLMQYACV